MTTRYTITAVKKNGQRELAFDNNGRNNYLTEKEAHTMLLNVIQNNGDERVAHLVGSDLRIDPVECYDNGDSTKTVFS